MAADSNLNPHSGGHITFDGAAMLLVIIISIATCVFVGLNGMAASVWGLVPILLYAALCVWGLDIVLATAVALVAAFAILQPQPAAVGKMLGSALSENVTQIGMISVLGARLGEVLRATGVASNVVNGVLSVIGQRSKSFVILGIMFAAALVIFMLGTIGGALAIAAPILIPLASRFGITRRATAVAFLYGGCAGLALAPFAGSNIAIMVAAKVSYLDYVTYGAGPLFIISFVLGFPICLVLQKKAAQENDFYPPVETPEEAVSYKASKQATATFLIGLVITVSYALHSGGGVSVPMIALPLLAFLTGTVGRNAPTETLKQFYRGAGAVIHLFLLFWLLSTLFNVLDELGPLKAMATNLSADLTSFSKYSFALVVALIGLAGVPGASAAVVVLVDNIFGGMAAQVGISTAAWIIVLIFSSKGDTYGPFPNPNMVTCMGMARYDKLKYMLLSGWMLLIPATIVYAILLYFVV